MHLLEKRTKDCLLENHFICVQTVALQVAVMDYDLWFSVHFNPGNDPTKQNTKIVNQLMQCSAVEGECSVTCCSENALAFKRFRGLSSMANVCALVLMWNWALELFSFQFQTGNCWIYSNALLCFRMGPPSRVVSDYTLWDKLQLGRQAVVENLHRAAGDRLYFSLLQLLLRERAGLYQSLKTWTTLPFEKTLVEVEVTLVEEKWRNQLVHPQGNPGDKLIFISFVINVKRCY